jgi:uncharacterized protein involved in outer membrane biogenesis
MSLPPTPAGPVPRKSRSALWAIGTVALVAAAIGLLVVLWDWNWFRPLVEARASAAIGRRVTLERLEVHPGWITSVAMHELHIANPPGFEEADFAVIPDLSFTVDVATWWHTRRILLPRIDIDHPSLSLSDTPKGGGNWTFTLPPSGPGAMKIELGDIVIEGGIAHAVSVREKTDVTVHFATGRADDDSTLLADAKGTYSGQPITARARGGALLSISDTTKPYPIDFSLINGQTKISLRGTVQDPLAMTGANLELSLSGADMAALLPLIGIPVANTPPYHVTGKLEFAGRQIKFTDLKGQVGSSDLEGALDVDRRNGRPLLSGTLSSRSVDMKDLAGFIGAPPGRETTPGETTSQVRALRQAQASPRLLPNIPISIPKIEAADIHITYEGKKILGRNLPFDSLSVKLNLDDGRIRLTPLTLSVSGGIVSGNFDLEPAGNELNADVNVTIKHVNIARILSISGLGSGQGVVDGQARLKGRGASLAAILAHGNGELYMYMPRGGDVNALLIDLSGVEIGPALLAAMGVPNREAVRCMVANFALQQGVLATRQLVMDTTEHIISGGGRIDLSREVLQIWLRTDPKHFTIGKLATPIQVYGPLKHLSFAPDPEIAERAGAAVILGALFPPAALLPTIHFGVGDQSPCVEPRK